MYEKQIMHKNLTLLNLLLNVMIFFLLNISTFYCELLIEQRGYLS